MRVVEITYTMFFAVYHIIVFIQKKNAYYINKYSLSIHAIDVSC
jgi:hypothetical protein